jgi:flagellar biosynthesis/type III secretory pathway ATPase
VLSRELCDRNHWPAIDVLPSLSRVMNAVVDERQRAAAGRVRELMAAYEQKRDLIALGAYKRGSDVRTDEAIEAMDAINTFLRQGTHEVSSFEETRQRLLALV